MQASSQKPLTSLNEFLQPIDPNSFAFCPPMASSSSNVPTAPRDLSTAVLIRVDHSGKGDHTRIQDAINSVPSHSSELYFIWVKPGIYREKIVVPADKPYITISGTRKATTVITWGGGGEIFESPTLSVLASDFVGRYLSIRNAYGSRAHTKAVALRVSADRAAFYGCRIQSYQDTLLDDIGRHYYKYCYIEGAIDFICGSATSLFEKCHLHSVAEGFTGTITAQNRKSESENSAFVFLDCRITGTGSAFLGRPWGAYSRVVFAYTYMSQVVTPQGWDNWDEPSKERTVYYGEHKCFGPGAKRTRRVAWSQNLTSDEAAPFLTTNLIGGRGWLRPTPKHFKTPTSSTTVPAKKMINSKL
uniref:pectinesterase n=1 Tax=Kalanchoe fedtschenkoi TaxID=63787 RepID=A0A7N0TE03_KALFE